MTVSVEKLKQSKARLGGTRIDYVRWVVTGDFATASMLPPTLTVTAGMDSSKASQVEEWAALVSQIICVLGN